MTLDLQFRQMPNELQYSKVSTVQQRRLRLLRMSLVVQLFNHKPEYCKKSNVELMVLDDKSENHQIYSNSTFCGYYDHLHNCLAIFGNLYALFIDFFFLPLVKIQQLFGKTSGRGLSILLSECAVMCLWLSGLNVFSGWKRAAALSVDQSGASQTHE